MQRADLISRPRDHRTILALLAALFVRFRTPLR